MPNEEQETGISIIAKERKRQIEEKGYTPEIDNRHMESLAYAAACYAIPDVARNIYAGQGGLSNVLTKLWPWEMYTFKRSPNNRIKELAKAGALIAAEIDRLQRLNQKK